MPMQPEMGAFSAQKQADILKDKGNQYFRKEKLGAAIEAYTEAITLCPKVPLYWTNRALCERKRHEWEKVEADCRRALELDNHNVKAYYLLGLALVHYQQYEEAVKQLEKAMDLGRGAEGNYIVEEIWQELAKARYVEWEAVSEVREQQQLDLKLHLSQLLREDYDRQLDKAIASIKAAAASNTASGIHGLSQVEMEKFMTHLGNTLRESTESNKIESKKSGTGSDQRLTSRSNSRVEKLHRAQSEVPSSIQEESEAIPDIMIEPDETKTAFHPLKQHKLSLRRNTSLRRQRSLSPDEFDTSAAPESREGSETEEAAASLSEKIRYPDVTVEMGENMDQKASTAAHEASVHSADASESTSNSKSGSCDAPEFHSIFDVFKVFKEFMKLKQNEASQKLLKLSELYQRRSNVLEDVFERAGAADKPADIPDHLCCKITLDIFRDPVISTSGITYERAAILNHLRKVGQFDPFTREHLTAEHLVPNLAVKEAVQAYLDQHGWAYGQ